MEDNPQVNIYIETTVHGPAQRGGRYMYLLECTGRDGRPRTKQAVGAWQDEKENRLALQALAESLERLKASCIVDVYTTCPLIRNVIENGWIDSWRQDGWENRKGQPVKNRDLWERIATGMERNLLFVNMDPHPYRDWMRQELKREGSCGSNTG